MTTAQGNVSLLEDPTALDLLQSRQLARLSYTWHDGTPRFHCGSNGPAP